MYELSSIGAGISLVLVHVQAANPPQDCEHRICRQEVFEVRECCEVRQISERLTNVSNLTSSEVSGTKQGAGGESVHPVLVPKQV